jgi:hypothetical protein
VPDRDFTQPGVDAAEMLLHHGLHIGSLDAGLVLGWLDHQASPRVGAGYFAYLV